MGCQSSAIVEVIPVEAHEIHQNHPEHAKEQPLNNGKETKAAIDVTPSKTNRKGTHSPDKENAQPLKLSIKFAKPPLESTNSGEAELTKRKSRSEHRLPEEVLNQTANIQKPTEEKKKSLIISEKGKTFSVKEAKQKQSKALQEEPIGPSAHSIPEQKAKEEEKISGGLLAPIVIQKSSAPQVEGFAEEPQIQSLSEELKSDRSGKTAKSFKFQVYVESSAEILSKTQKMNQKLSIFIQKEQVARYLQMIEFGEKEQILGKIFEELQKKEEWNEMKIASSKSCEPMVVVVTEQGVTISHQ